MVGVGSILISILFCGAAFGKHEVKPHQSYRGQVVFIGDSITYFWVQNGYQQWAEFYEPVGAVNTGWPGDSTNNVIDKIRNDGIIDNLNSRVAVLLIGTNDLDWVGNDENTVYENTGTILSLIKTKNPGVKIILLAILPRNDAEVHQRIRNTNLLIEKYGDNESVFFLNMEAQFSNQLGSMLPGMSDDGVHLTQLGYTTWTQAMNPLFFALLEDGETPPPPSSTTPHSSTTPPSACTNAVFLGDSITDFFDSDGLATWNEFYAPLGAVNTGVSGDWTTDTIDRINNGIISNLGAHVAILKIGTNDLSGGRPENQIAENIATIISLIKEKNPGVTILLLGILPRNGEEISQRVRNVNEIIQNFADNSSVFFLNMEQQFSTQLGTVISELYRDGLHLTAQGYAKWAETMNPLFFSILDSTPRCGGRK